MRIRKRAEWLIFGRLGLVFFQLLQTRMRLSQWELRRISTGVFQPLSFAFVRPRWTVRESEFSNRDGVLTWSRDSIFEAELQDVIPICHATIAGTRIVGRLTAGYVQN